MLVRAPRALFSQCLSETPREGGELYLWNTRMEGLGSVFEYWYLNKNFFLSSSYANEDLQRQFSEVLASAGSVEGSSGRSSYPQHWQTSCHSAFLRRPAYFNAGVFDIPEE